MPSSSSSSSSPREGRSDNPSLTSLAELHESEKQKPERDTSWIALDGIERSSDERSAVLWGPLYVGLAFSLDVVLSGLLVKKLLEESLYDGSYLRLAILAAVPFLVSRLDHPNELIRKPNYPD